MQQDIALRFLQPVRPAYAKRCGFPNRPRALIRLVGMCRQQGGFQARRGHRRTQSSREPSMRSQGSGDSSSNRHSPARGRPDQDPLLPSFTLQVCLVT